ncbi:MAG: ABC transporter ATP-binding protein [Bacilli bacterium]|nr:ABC transporter ATP-binding protein [Bacilli bacterium]
MEEDKKKKSSFMTNVKKTWAYIKDCKLHLVGYASVSIFEGIIGAIIPILLARIILNITDGAIKELIYTALITGVIEALLYILYYFKGFYFQRIYQRTLTRLQIAVARETLRLEISEIDKESSGLFIDRLNKDTQEISSMFMEFTYWTSYVISNVGVLIGLFVLNKYLFLFNLIEAIIIFFINKKRLSKQYEVQANVKKIQEKKTGLTGELVRGIRDIKVLNANDTILKQTTEKIMDTSNEEIKMLDISRKYGYIENNTRGLCDLLFILLGCLLLKNELLTVTVFVIVYNYQSRVKNLLMGIVQLLEYNKKFTLASNRIFEVIGDERFKKETFGNKKLEKLEGKIEFKNVTFGYDENKTILDKMKFTINPNETVAFVGKSGAGKTTIFSLITRLYHINSGKILLDGIEIDDLDCSSLRDNMSIITQSSYIFNMTIKENLLLAKEDATEEEIKKACHMACIDEFIETLPEKYDTKVGENGMILSGGQRQRIAIARALLMKTEIILFDEATSALDNETQEEIQKAIKNMKGEYTILIIAHRLSTVVDADRIFVVDDGKIIATGSHKELLKNCDFYKKLYEKDLEGAK